MFKTVFPWLDPQTPVERIAVLVSHPTGRDHICGAKIQSIDELMVTIGEKVRLCGIMAKSAIPEMYPLLRTIQLTVCGYYRAKPLGTP